MSVWLYLAQRLSAIVMVPLVLGHLILMIIAIQNGLTASEILGRTQGSMFWAAYYGLFVAAVAVHAAIGLRNIAAETFRWRGAGLDLATAAVGTGLLVMGGRAVIAVVA
ncbi:MAG: succinate dehydrogenase [Rhodomicrobium sp.]|nr:succinate dehydrogenase [Rhodomicrobium sp.]